MSPIGYLPLLILVLSILLAGERVRSALLRWEQTQYAWALQQLALLRALWRQFEGREEPQLLATIARIILEVTGERANIHQLFDVRTEPPLAMTFADRQGRHYTFTPQPAKARGLYPGGRWFVVDGLTAHPFTIEELAGAFVAAVSLQRPEEVPVIPRSEQWGLLVWSGPKGDSSR